MDDEDYGWLNEYKWHISNGYAIAHFYQNEKRTTKRMHRLIMNEPQNFQIDHINRNKLNNTKINLRVVTNSQNQMNSPKQKGSSKFKGVWWHKNTMKWVSVIKANKIKYYLGYFENEEDAARAYNKKAKEVHGEYAYLNKV